MLTKLRKYVNAPIVVQIIKTYALARIEYGDMFIPGITKLEIEKLQKLLKGCLRVALCPNKSMGRLSNYDLHKRVNLLPLSYRREITLLKQMFICSHDNRYVENQDTRKGQSKREIRIKNDFPKYAKYRKSIFYEGPRLWRVLPTDIKSVDDISVFENKLVKHYWMKLHKTKVILSYWPPCLLEGGL